MLLRRLILAGGAGAALLAASAPGFAAEHTVKPGQSIQAAIDGASDNDTIYIKGAHNQSFTVTKPLVFAGKNGSLTGIGLEGPIMTVESGGSGSSFTKLVFRFTEGEDSAVVLESEAEDLTFDRCLFKGIEGTAVYCDGNAGIDYLSCQFIGNGGDIYGWVWDHYEYRSLHRRAGDTAVYLMGTTAIEQSTFDLCRGSALYVEGGGVGLSLGVGEFGGENHSVSNSSISRGRSGIGADWTYGLWISGVSGYQIRDTFLHTYGADGAEILDCRAVVCGDDAFYMDGSYASTLSGNLALKAEVGIDVYGEMNTIEGNVVQYCDEGIYVGASSGSTTATVTGNSVLDITGIGIEVSGHSEPVIGGNFLRGVSGYESYEWFEEEGGAITVVDCYSPLIVENRVGDVDGGFGILVSSCDYAEVVFNDVRATLLAGIRLDADDYGYQPELTLINEGPSGYYSYYSAVAYNSVVACGDPDGAGIELHNQVFFYVFANLVSNSGGVGIATDWCWEGGLSSNSVLNSERDGIWIMGGGDLEISANTVVNSGAEGIQNSSCDDVTISGNGIWGSTFLDIANNGSIDTEGSGGNVNKKGNSIDPSDWDDIEPIERNYGGCDD